MGAAHDLERPFSCGGRRAEQHSRPKFRVLDGGNLCCVPEGLDNTVTRPNGGCTKAAQMMITKTWSR